MLTAWLACWSLSRELAARERIDGDWRWSAIVAGAIWGVCSTLIVEMSSLLRCLNAPMLLASWCLVNAGLWGMALAFVRNRKGRLTEWLSRWPDVWGRFKVYPWDVRLLLILIGSLVAVLGVIAIATPTTNWDSFTYHLPRVMHWIQQGSVEHFPTGNTRQIESGPWSAFILTNLYLLEGSDRFFNLVQWLAMVGSVVAASLLARQLWHLAEPPAAESVRSAPDDRTRCQRGEALAALLVVTLPIGLVESITTQTDYGVTFWLACLANFALAAWKEPRHGWYALGMGATLGLGLLTKVTMIIYAAPMVAALLARWWWQLPGLGAKLRPSLMVGVAVLLLNAPHWSRNLAVFGSPLGSQATRAIQCNRNISLASTFSNLIRNLTLETNTGIRPLTRKLNQLLFYAHRLSGKDINDPDITYPMGRFGFFPDFFVDDSYASNPYHGVLILAAAGLALRRWRCSWPRLVYVVLIGVSFVAFCGYLRWQQWHTRMHLAYLVLLMPWVAVELERFLAGWRMAVVGGGLLGFAVFSLLDNQNRPVADAWFRQLPRENQYLVPYDLPKKLATANTAKFQQIADEILASDCRRIGLKLRAEDAEYLIWRFLINRGFRGSLEHVWVENESAQLQNPLTFPEAIITSYAGDPPAMIARRFPFKTDYGHFQVYSPRPIGRGPP